MDYDSVLNHLVDHAIRLEMNLAIFANTNRNQFLRHIATIRKIDQPRTRSLNTYEDSYRMSEPVMFCD